MAIYFNNLEIDFKLKNKLKLKQWLKSIAEFEQKSIGTLTYIFTSDKELLIKNKKFLKHTTLTDIITFDYSDGNKLTGDIFISIERVYDNAKKFKVSFDEELNRVIIHGILHLCGYKDKTKLATQLMRKKENWALSKL